MRMRVDLVAALVNDELQRRQDRLLARRHKQARFRDPDRSLGGFDFAFNTKIDRTLVYVVVGLLKPRFSGRESTGLIDEVGAWSFCCVTTARALAVSLLLTELGLSSAIAVAFEKLPLERK